MKRNRLLVFKVVTVLIVPLTLLALLESGLRLIGFGYSASVFDEEKGIVPEQLGLYIPLLLSLVGSPADEVGRVFGREERAWFAEGVFVLGGSAAQGYPASEYGMANQIQVKLENIQVEGSR